MQPLLKNTASRKTAWQHAVIVHVKRLIRSVLLSRAF